MKTKIYIEKKGKFAGDVKIEILPPSDKNLKLTTYKKFRVFILPINPLN